MVEWAATDDGLHAFAERATVAVGVDGWRPCRDAPALASRVDAIAVGATHGVELPAGSTTLADGANLQTGGRLPEGVHEVAVDADHHGRTLGERVEAVVRCGPLDHPSRSWSAGCIELSLGRTAVFSYAMAGRSPGVVLDLEWGRPLA